MKKEEKIIRGFKKEQLINGLLAIINEAKIKSEDSDFGLAVRSILAVDFYIETE